MKRKRTYRPPNTTLQNPAAAVVAEPETSHSKSVNQGRTDENITSPHMQTGTLRTGTVMMGRQVETENNVNGSMETYPVLGKMIAAIIREISKDAGSLANLSRSLVTNSVSNRRMGQPRGNMDYETNQRQLHQNPDYKKPELNAALAVIKKTMRLEASNPFNSPVDPIALGIPDYFDVIDTPIDFGTICKNLENGLKYMNSVDVYKDVEDIWHNCLKYNKKGHPIVELMNQVKTYFMKYWKAAGLYMEQSPDLSARVDVLPPTEPYFSRHNERLKDYPLDPFCNNFTQLQQKEAGSNKYAESRLGPINMQVGQYQQSSSQLQPSPEPDEPNIDFVSTLKTHQGHTCGSYKVAESRMGLINMQAGQYQQSSSRLQLSPELDEPNIDFVSTLKTHQGCTHGSYKVAESRPGPINMQSGQYQQSSSQLQPSPEPDEPNSGRTRGSYKVPESRPGPINMQAGQYQQTSSQLQPSPEPDEPNSDFVSTLKKHRGQTRCLKLLNTVGRIKIVTNELGEPVGPEVTQLTSFLGLTARDGNLAPLTYPSWSKMPKEKKESMWQNVLTKFDIDPSCRSWVLLSLKGKWRTFKFYLKSTHYDTHSTDEERLGDRDERVLPDQWSFLVSKWSSEEWQSISARNKAKRAKVKFSHTSGSKSFARIREEERKKRPDGQEPSQAELFILTRTRKDGQPVNEETAAVISQLHESTTANDAYNRVMGLDRNGSVSLYGTKALTRAEVLRMVTKKNEEVAEMKERLKSVEQTCSQMASQMSAMVSMMATMQKGSSHETFPNTVAGTSGQAGTPSQSEFTSTHTYEIPAKKTRGRNKRR